MKKVMVLFIAITAVFTLLSFGVFADEPAETVYVTISVEGEIVLENTPVYLSDSDGDGVHTLNDALYVAHEERYDGGAESGYNSYKSEFGISLGKLWGDTSGAFGYCVNNESALGLTQEVKKGDIIYAYVYKDQAEWSDRFSFFDKSSVSVDKDEMITLNLKSNGFDKNWQTVTEPLLGAVITVNGENTEYKTDENGNVSFRLDGFGSFIVSAEKDGETLVPPICSVTVNKSETGIWGYVGIAVAVFSVLFVIGFVIGKKYAKK